MSMVGASGPHLFAQEAPAYAEAGLIPFPCNGKHAAIRQWQKRKRTDLIWMSRQFPAANIGIIDGVGITRVDIDDSNLIDYAIDRFGDTPVKVRTPGGGMHLWYRSSGERRRLRIDGLKIDILGKGGYGLAPPSVADDAQYRFEEGDIGQLGALPSIHPEALQSASAAATHNDRRNDTLFRHLLRQVRQVEGFEGLMKLANARNAEFADGLPDGEVTKTAKSAWRYREQNSVWMKGPSRAVVTPDLIDLFGGYGTSAHGLWTFIQHNHGARKEPIVLGAAAAKSIGWGYRKFQSARDKLENKGLIVCLHRGGGWDGDAGAYWLTEWGQKPENPFSNYPPKGRKKGV